MTNDPIGLQRIKTISKLALLHVLLMAFNAYSHQKLGTIYYATDHLATLLLFSLAPLIAAYMLETHSLRYGNILLQGTIAAALIFNIYSRFFSLELPEVLPPPFLWKFCFEGTFGMLLISEVILFWLGIKVFLALENEKK